MMGELKHPVALVAGNSWGTVAAIASPSHSAGHALAYNTAFYTNGRYIMRSIVCQTFVSLDGVINHMERWHFAYTDAESEALALAQLQSSGALLMGRKTYEVYAGVWPNREGEYPDLINRLPKYVVSSTLTDATWSNTTVISEDPVAAIRALKEEDGEQILMHGYGPLAKNLLAEGVLDELHLWLHPVLAGVGSGEDLLLQEGLNRVLQLEDAKTLGSGVVILKYRNQPAQ